MDTALTPGTSYYYTVRATDAAGISNPTAAVVGVTPTIPASPSNLVAVTIKAIEVVLDWKDNASNATSVQVLRQTGPTGHYVVIATLGPTAKSYADRKVSPGSAYSYEIHAVNLAGASTSDDVPVTTPAL
jgi:titin